MRATTVITTMFDLSDPDELGCDSCCGQRLDRPRRRGGRVHVLHARPARRAFVRRAGGVARRSGGAVREVRRVARGDAGDRTVTAHRRVVRAHPPRRHRRRASGPASVSSPTSGTAGWNAIPRTRCAAPVRASPSSRSPTRSYGTFERPSPGGRVVPGDGDLALDEFVARRTRRRVHGSVRARGRGTRDRGRGARRRAATRRRPHQRAPVRGAPVSRAIVFHGDETWEERDLPVPDTAAGWRGVARRGHRAVPQRLRPLPRSGAHARTAARTRRSRATRSSGRIETITPEAAAEWGVDEGDRVAVRNLVVTPEGFRIYGHDFSVDEGSGLYGGFAEHLELLPGSAVFRLRDDLPAEELTIFEPLSCAVTWVHPVQPDDVVVIEGPGHMGMATIVAARAAGAATVIVTGTAQDRFRLDVAQQRRRRSRDRRRRRGPGRARRRDHRRRHGRRRDRRRLGQSRDRHARHGDGAAGAATWSSQG